MKPVSIFNDVLGLVTYSSCEGHLFKKRVQASIHSRISLDQLKLIKKVIRQKDMLPLKRRPRKKNVFEASNIGKDYMLASDSQKEIFENKFDDSSVRFEYKQSARIKKYYGIFSVRIIPKHKHSQNEWDKIRQEKFSNVIKTLYDSGLRACEC